LALSVRVFTHRDPQISSPVPAQEAWQLPSVQYFAEPEQVVPQAPQLSGSFALLVQAAPPPQWPVVQAEEPLQSTWLVGQVQVPLVQVAPGSQALPQPPQLALSVRVFTHTALQTASPVPAQEAAQLPSVQYFAEPEQVVPQVPQLSGSCALLVHAAVPPQWPVVQVNEPLQSTWLVGQVQVPLAQVAPGSQT
jgi:hypothetical protein